jgi:hypothetical protein
MVAKETPNEIAVSLVGAQSSLVIAKFCSGCSQGLVAAAVVCPSCGTASNAAGNYGASPKGAKDKTVAILLAIFLGFWTWLYTYEKDKNKFWISLGVIPLGILICFAPVAAYNSSASGSPDAIIATFAILWLALVGIHIWSIVQSVSRSNVWYSNYPNG